MFESDFKRLQKSKRKGEYGTTTSPGKGSVEDTVYGELKLSE
jgi:hypothetical protein